MKLHVLATIALFFSPTNCFILQKVGESLHKITNAIIPHEHHHHHHEHCGHHHDPNYDEAIGSNSPTDTREQYDYRRPIPKQPPHSYPDRPYYNPDERPHRKPFNRPNSGYDKDNEVQVTTIKNLVLVDETTTSVEGAEGNLVMPIDVRSGPDMESRRLVNPGSNCGSGQRADSAGRCRAIFG